MRTMPFVAAVGCAMVLSAGVSGCSGSSTAAGGRSDSASSSVVQRTTTAGSETSSRSPRSDSAASSSRSASSSTRSSTTSTSSAVRPSKTSSTSASSSAAPARSSARVTTSAARSATGCAIYRNSNGITVDPCIRRDANGFALGGPAYPSAPANYDSPTKRECDRFRTELRAWARFQNGHRPPHATAELPSSGDVQYLYVVCHLNY